MKKAIKFASQALATFVLVVGVLVLVGGVLIPRLTGATTYAVLANSMAPRYPMGTLMVVRERDTISTGDIITFQPAADDPMVVSHRVIGIGSTTEGEPRFATQGDANDVPDIGLVLPEQIRGVMWYAIPFAGYLVVGVNSGRQYANLVLAGLLAVYAIWQVVGTMKDKSKARNFEPVVDVPAGSNVAQKLENSTVTMTEYVAPILLPKEPIPTEVLAEVVPVEVTPFQLPMTRAERRRLASLSASNEPDFSLAS